MYWGGWLKEFRVPTASTNAAENGLKYYDIDMGFGTPVSLGDNVVVRPVPAAPVPCLRHAATCILL